MKKLCALLITMMLMSGCYIFKKPLEMDKPYVYIYTKIEFVYTYEQFDSFCTVDNLPKNLDDWDVTLYIDKKPLKEYLYLVDNGDTTITYSAVLKDDSTILLTKRIIIE